MSSFGISRKAAMKIILPIAVAVLIIGEVLIITSYHSGSGFVNSDRSEVAINQTEAIVIAKLPSASVRVELSETPIFGSGAGFPNLSVIAPHNNSMASISLHNFNSSQYAPYVIITFNTTRATGTSSTLLESVSNLTLSASNPVSFNLVNLSKYPELEPSITAAANYDFIVIELTQPVDWIQYAWVSR